MACESSFDRLGNCVACAGGEARRRGISEWKAEKNNPGSVIRAKDNSRVVRESFLMGPGGGVKLETIWEGTKLITRQIYLEGNLYSHLDFNVHESESSLEEYLRKCSKRYLLLGKGIESARYFASIDLSKIKVDYCIGIIYSGTGIQPSAIYFKSAEKIMVGHDCSVSFIGLFPFTICYIIDIIGAFYEFLHVTENATIIVHELGLVKLDLIGKRLWKVDTDIVERFEINDKMEISIWIMDSRDKLIIDGRTGLRIN